MRKHHPENERIKRAYFIYLKEANRLSEASIDQAAAAIASFEASTSHKGFKAFHIDQARRFKRSLEETKNTKTGRPLSKATIHSRLMALKAFFKWLAEQPGYKSRISRTDCDYFNDSANDERIAKAEHNKPVPTLEQIRHTLRAMPDTTVFERRNRALFAFIILTGARDDAIASMLLRDVDVKSRTVQQDARHVRTKNRKTFESVFFPVGEEFEQPVLGWIVELRETHLFGPDDPLFPPAKVGVGPNGKFAPIGLQRSGWKSADTIRQIVRGAFEAVRLPYFNPHSFRKTLTSLGETICRTPEEFKAWSQNLGHEKVMTTFKAYGEVARSRQAEIINGLNERNSGSTAGVGNSEAILEQVRKLLRK